MSDIYKHVWSEPATQYGFPELLKALLDADEAAQRALIAKNPITKSWAFEVYRIDMQDEVKQRYARAIEARHAGSDNKDELREGQRQLKQFKVIQSSMIAAFAQPAAAQPAAAARPAPRPAPAPAPAPARVGPRYRLCGMCSGVGRTRCSSCGGTGTHSRSASRTRHDGRMEYYTEQVPCYSCSGGKVSCTRCGGSGQVLV